MICYIIIAAVYLVHYGYVESFKNPLTIGGGDDTDIRTHKYMVSIHVQGYRCGGCIITHALVITAAHCTKNISIELISVHVGSSHPVEGGEYKRISDKFEHPRFNFANRTNDICLVLLEDRLTYGENIGAINLANSGEMPLKYGLSDGTLIKALGFGEMQDGSYAQKLQEGYFRIVNHNLCQRAYNIVMDLRLCASSLSKNLKNGDDGSPVLYENKLVGIVSLVDNDYERRFSVLAYVPSYLRTLGLVMEKYP